MYYYILSAHKAKFTFILHDKSQKTLFTLPHETEAEIAYYITLNFERSDRSSSQIAVKKKF